MSTILRLVPLYFVAAVLAQAQMAPRVVPFDVVIEHGHIVDGTGSPWYSGDVGIRGGRIVAIGRLASAPRKQTIDAAGKVVAPGFIDMLGQSEMTILVDPRLPSKIYQGITTEITGEGGSVAPDQRRDDLRGSRRICAPRNHARLANVSRILCTH